MTNSLVFHVFDVIVLLGIIQAMIMALVINRREAASRLFGLILLTLAALGFKILLHTLGLWQLSAFHHFPLAIDTLLPALLYAYLLAVTGQPLSSRRFVLYLLPTILLMIHALLVYFTGQDLRYDDVKAAEDICAMILSAICWSLGLRTLQRYRAWLYSTQSDSRLEEYLWLRNLLILSGIMVLAFCLITVLHGRHFIVVQGFYIYLAGVSYYLSLKGYALYSVKREQVLSPVLEAPEPAALSGDQLLIKERITAALESDRLYLRPDLNLKELATHIGVPAGSVSAVINQAFGQNFRNLINAYRVEAVKEMLRNPPAHLSLLGIALECGFNSEASFYRIFRQFTGVSPNHYTQNRF